MNGEVMPWQRDDGGCSVRQRARAVDVGKPRLYKGASAGEPPQLFSTHRRLKHSEPGHRRENKYPERHFANDARAECGARSAVTGNLRCVAPTVEAGKPQHCRE